MSIWEYANPVKFMRVSGAVLPWVVAGAALCTLTGLVWGFLTPEDYKQGSTVKIIFLHVPAALMAINIWLMMLVTSLIWLIRRHHVSALAARAAAPVARSMTTPRRSTRTASVLFLSLFSAGSDRLLMPSFTRHRGRSRRF